MEENQIENIKVKKEDKILDLINELYPNYISSLQLPTKSVILNNLKAKLISIYCRYKKLEIIENNVLENWDSFEVVLRTLIPEELIIANKKINQMLDIIKNNKPIEIDNIILTLRDIYGIMGSEENKKTKAINLYSLFINKKKLDDNYILDNISDFKSFLEKYISKEVLDSDDKPKEIISYIRNENEFIKMNKLIGRFASLPYGPFNNDIMQKEIVNAIQFKNQWGKLDFIIELKDSKRLYRSSELIIKKNKENN